ncbi:EamA family transporter [Microbulbifer sp. A4B17]|uniref:DMT family transporter n=1 Tax=Microbulbifer sp. A4B17 TaxID=359370 RepID=UPI000D52C84C|nr:DMT family transporter [Microbulbifer sp. A4B17]AWF81658.1 EamA family transporter [Microbulbifer sp. A4B17]
MDKQPSVKSTRFWLWISILIFAASNAVVAKIGELGASHPINGNNPISFCNLLFAGNLLAGITLLIIYRKDWRLNILKQYPFKDWFYMFVLILMSGVLAPAFFFIALMLTEVTNVVLIATLDAPLGLLLAYLMFRERPTGFSIVGALVVTIGVIAIFALHQPPMEDPMSMKMLNLGNPAMDQFLQDLPKAGEILTAVATLLGVIAVQASRKLLDRVPIGVFSVFRMLAGVILFSIIVLSVFGPHHFDDLFSPFLWVWMLVYGAIIIVFGQITWFKGLQGGASSADISIATAITPVAGTLFAFLILQEVPNFAQIVGGIIIMAGIGISLLGQYREQKAVDMKYEKPCSFKGV